MERRDEVLYDSTELVANNPKQIYLPKEILGIIAQYVYPKPMSVGDAMALGSSGCKWDKIVLKTTMIELFDYSFQLYTGNHPSQLEPRSAHGLLYASSPAKLMIHLYGDGHGLDFAVQSLLHFRTRWHSFSVAGDCDQGAIREALFAVPCHNCPPFRLDGPTECEDHTILPSLFTFSVTKDWTLRLFSGMLKNIKHVILTVNDEYGTGFPLDLVTETPTLSELTVHWHVLEEHSELAKSNGRIVLPMLRRISFVQVCRTTGRQDVEMAFGRLDCTKVEELCVHNLDLDGDWTKYRRGVLNDLGVTFPFLTSLSLTTKPSGGRLPEEILLGMLTEGSEESPAIFPRLTHLALEMDHTLDNANLLLPVLRRDHRQGAQQIRSLDLFTDLPPHEIADIRDSDDFIRIQGEVHQLTVRTSNHLHVD